MSSVSHVVYPLTWLMCPSYILGINKPASATGRHVPTVALIENFAAFPPALWLSVRLYAAAFPGLVCISGALSSIHGTAAGNSSVSCFHWQSPSLLSSVIELPALVCPEVQCRI